MWLLCIVITIMFIRTRLRCIRRRTGYGRLRDRRGDLWWARGVEREGGRVDSRGARGNFVGVGGMGGCEKEKWQGLRGLG